MPDVLCLMPLVPCGVMDVAPHGPVLAAEPLRTRRNCGNSYKVGPGAACGPAARPLHLPYLWGRAGALGGGG